MIRRYTLIGVSGEDVKLRRCGVVVLCISCVFNVSGETVIGNVRFSERVLTTTTLSVSSRRFNVFVFSAIY